MQTWLDRNRGWVFGLFTALTVVGAAVFYWRLPTQTPIEIIPSQAPTLAPEAPAAPAATPTASPTPAPVRVYITGAVVNSDVYYLPAGSIIKDAVEIAGGFTAKADPTRINLALQLQDQQQIHVPILGEENSPPIVQGGSQPEPTSAPASIDSNRVAPTGKINLNNASLEELDALPGIGPAIAQRVIDYRDNIGGFTAIEQITQVSGIGDATFAKIAPLITVE